MTPHLLAPLAALVALAALPGMAATPSSHWNGGRTVPVHKLAPRDADGEKVSPLANLPRPISLKQTCGQCHDVAALHRGSHFRTGLDLNDAPAAHDGEPWFLADEALGTAIPLSLHGQAGAWRPADVGLSCWQWTKLFGRHFPGGGIACDTNALNEVAHERQRWFVTGPLEPNCLACHQQTGYDSSEWVRQVCRENWQGAATAASGLGEVGGMNSRLESSWVAAENPDDHLFKVPETTTYDHAKFDAKGRCVFDVGKPQNANCLACHGVSQKGMPSHVIAGDVHLQRGLRCVDCHVNGMDHRVETTSCAACHTGKDGAGPKPVHAGIPLVHFKTLACTVCHAGVTEGGAPAQVRTARANRIGVYGRAQWATDTPAILEPVFVRNEQGVIEPRRMMWPSGFYRADAKGALTPLAPDAARLMTSNAFAAVSNDTAITRAKIQVALKNAGPTVRYVAGGLVYALDAGGALVTTAGAPEAQPVSWAFGHDVRPARQARGAAPVTCAACHTADSAFFLGEIAPLSPVVDGNEPTVKQADLLKVDGFYYATLGTTFAMRPLFKFVLWTVFALLCLFVAAAAAAALNRLGKWIAAHTTCFAWGLAKWIVDVGFVACLAYLVLSGLIGWLCGAMAGWALVLHMVAGGGLAVSAALIAGMRAAERTERTLALACAWAAWTFFAAATVFTAVMPMMTVFGSHGQDVLLWSHRLAALAFAALSALVCALCCRERNSTR